MARKANPSDYTVPVDGLGNFKFGRRKMADEIQVQVEYSRLIDGVEPTQWLSLVAGWISTLKVLTVSAPDGWDVDELDPLDDDTYANLKRVYDLLTEKEQSFRRSNGKGGESGRAGAVGDSGILVPEEVQPASN